MAVLACNDALRAPAPNELTLVPEWGSRPVQRRTGPLGNIKYCTMLIVMTSYHSLTRGISKNMPKQVSLPALVNILYYCHRIALTRYYENLDVENPPVETEHATPPAMY